MTAAPWQPTSKRCHPLPARSRRSSALRQPMLALLFGVRPTPRVVDRRRTCMIRMIAALAAVAVGATAVHAQNTQAVALRQATMKQYGRAIVVLGKIAKGDIAFDLSTIQATLKTIEETSRKAK